MAPSDTASPATDRTGSQSVAVEDGEQRSTSQTLTVHQSGNARRTLPWASVLVTALVAGLISPISYLATKTFTTPAPPQLDPTDYRGRARQILKSTPLIDGHNDLPYMLRVELQNKLYDGFNLSEKLAGHTDLQRMQDGQMGGQFWSVWIDCEPTPHTEDPTVRFPPQHGIRQLDGF